MARGWRKKKRILSIDPELLERRIKRKEPNEQRTSLATDTQPPCHPHTLTGESVKLSLERIRESTDLLHEDLVRQHIEGTTFERDGRVIISGLETSAKLVENCSEVGWAALDPLWGKVTGLADNFRITIPDLHNECESTFDHSSS